MALNCKICDKPMNAMNSVRCKKCRQLVCSSCLSDIKTEEGDICSGCASEMRSSETSAQSEKCEGTFTGIFSLLFKSRFFAKAVKKIKYINSHSGFFIFGALLVVIFLTIVFMPMIKAKYFRYKLGSEDYAEAHAALRELKDNPGQAVNREMLLELEYGTDTTRRYAMEVLGESGSKNALPLLYAIVNDPEESAEMKSYAEEAIIRIEEH